MDNIRKAFAVPFVVAALFFSCSVLAAERPEFDDRTVIAVMKPQTGITLFSDPFEGLGIEKIENLDSDTGGITLFSGTDEETVLKLTLSEAGEENVLSVIEELNKRDGIEYAQPDYFYYLDAAADDYYYVSGYQYNLTKIGAEYVWDMDIDGSNMAVAVIDSGMMMTHEDLAGNLWTNPDEIADNGIDDDKNGYIDDVHGWDFGNSDNDPSDKNGHGTHVAGIVSAVTGNGNGVASLAGNVKIVPLKVFADSGTSKSTYLYSAMRYVQNMGFKVANCSWGSGNYDSILKTRMLNCRDTVFTVSAGNAESGEEPNNNDTSPIYPASFTASNIISIASTDSADAISTFSNYGQKSVDIAAPGTAIYSTLSSSASAYGSKGGTSMAAPLVASTAALVRAARPDLSVKETIAVLLDNADSISSLSGKVAGGRRLNAYKTLNAVVPPKPTPTPAPIPTPKSVIQVTDASAVIDGDILRTEIEISGEYDIQDIRMYAAYRDKNTDALTKLSEMTLTEGLTAEIQLGTDFDSSDIYVYIWDYRLIPLYDVLKL